MVSAIQFLHQTVVGLADFFFFSLFSLFRFIFTYFCRHTNKGSISLGVVPECNIKRELNKIEPEPEPEPEPQTEPEPEPEIEHELRKYDEVIGSENDDDIGESQEISFTFKFPTFEEFIRSKQENGDFSIRQVDPAKNISQCELKTTFGVDEFIADEKADSDKDEDSMFDGLLSDMEDLKKPKGATSEINHEKKTENPEAIKQETDNNFRVYEESTTEGLSYSEKDSFFTGSDSESTSFGPVRSIMSRLIDSYSDGFLSDGNFEEFERDSLMNLPRSEISDLETEELDEYVVVDELETDPLQNSRNLTSEFLSEKDFPEKLENGSDSSEKVVNFEEANKLESLWEHQELIEQLQMELRKVKATGLPTILEESESPKITEDLKPWKIDDKFHHEDYISELHKIYKSYRERMRKLDILNYQKMYAIGFLQLKDPLQSITSQKSSGPTLISLVSQSFRLLKNKRHENDPMTKFIKELQSDLEVVYVGQMCLSWEFLHWQYCKAIDLWDSDPRGIHEYNEVADEFQQFQVLMQRFLEDEPLQGPRIQHYIKSRCVLRNLLHVPVIREDGLKEKRNARKREQGEYVITSDVLLEILEESIRILWKFIRADKDCSSVSLKGQREKFVELQNPEDTELLVEIKKNLLKKERKLKELLTGQNCILRKLKKHREEEDDDSEQVLYFFSQVDMKLVSRVLNMSRLTSDQLVWCVNKLSRISFLNKKIHVEPSFLLFPC